MLFFIHDSPELFKSIKPENTNHFIMKCVVCKRTNNICKLVTLFESTICGACKTSFYRSLEKLHNYLERIIFERSLQKTNPRLVTDGTRYEYRSQLLNVTELEQSVWKYLSNPELCKRNSLFSPGLMCEIECGNHGNLPCQHCRFRRTVIGMQKLELGSKKCSKNADSKLQHEIVNCVKNYSKRILDYCRYKLENSMDSRKLENFSEIVQAKVKNKNSLNPDSSIFISTVINSESVFPDLSIKLNQFVTYSAFTYFVMLRNLVIL